MKKTIITACIVASIISFQASAFDFGSFVGSVANQVVTGAANKNTNNNNQPQAVPQTATPNSAYQFGNEYNAIQAKYANCGTNQACVQAYIKEMNALQARQKAYSDTTGDQDFNGTADYNDAKIQHIWSEMNKHKQ